MVRIKTRCTNRSHAHYLCCTVVQAALFSLHIMSDADVPMQTANQTDNMNPETFVAPDRQATPTVTIEFCDQVCREPTIDVDSLILTRSLTISVVGEHALNSSHTRPSLDNVPGCTEQLGQQRSSSSHFLLRNWRQYTSSRSFQMILWGVFVSGFMYPTTLQFSCGIGKSRVASRS